MTAFLFLLSEGKWTFWYSCF